MKILILTCVFVVAFAAVWIGSQYVLPTQEERERAVIQKELDILNRALRKN